MLGGWVGYGTAYHRHYPSIESLAQLVGKATKAKGRAGQGRAGQADRQHGPMETNASQFSLPFYNEIHFVCVDLSQLSAFNKDLEESRALHNWTLLNLTYVCIWAGNHIWRVSSLLQIKEKKRKRKHIREIGWWKPWDWDQYADDMARHASIHCRRPIGLGSWSFYLLRRTHFYNKK